MKWTLVKVLGKGERNASTLEHRMGGVGFSRSALQILEDW